MKKLIISSAFMFAMAACSTDSDGDDVYCNVNRKGIRWKSMHRTKMSVPKKL